MLLAFDLDKTIVTSDHRLPNEIVTALQAARRAGHQITVLTGRTAPSAQPILAQLGIRDYYSVNHGALVMGGAGEVLRRAQIPAPQVQILLDKYQHMRALEPSCIIDDTLYVRDPTDPRWLWAHTLEQQLEHLSHYPGGAADKVVFYAPQDGVRLHQEISQAHPELVLYLWEDHFLEITGADGHKGAALELIAKTLGVPQRDTVAFGDGVNDISMVTWAGRGIAVGPSVHPEVLAAAAEHIASPEELGVVRWLEDNLLTVRG